MFVSYLLVKSHHDLILKGGLYLMSHPTRTEAIKAFLTYSTHSDLASDYNYGMECQVNVAQDNGEKIAGEFKGREWAGYTDGFQTWKPFRIPRNAMDKPEYEDVPMAFDLASHAEGIGMTGWNWVELCSKWVAFDFDAITGHSDKHRTKVDWDEMQRVKDAACEIPWVTVRYSTSGQGLHLYVYLNDVKSENHTVHAALARSILAKMSALTGYDFISKVDICGGNMWIWHRKMAGTNGLQIIKKGSILTDIPINWRDHINVIRGSSRKIRHNIPGSRELPEIFNKFEQLSGQRNRVKLDEDHRKLITWLNEHKRFFWWDADHHMLVTHTKHLADAHEALNFCGIFKTNSQGLNPDEQNCFAFPMRRGAWSVRRYSLGVTEDPSWEQDGSGWTKCYLNHEPNLKTAAAAHGGLEDPSGGFVFTSGADANEAALSLGADVRIPAGYDSRATTIKPHKDGRRVVVEFPRLAEDNKDKLQGWLQKGNKWIKIFNANLSNHHEADSDDYDDVVRHLISPDNNDAGWVLHSDEAWHDEPLNHIRPALESMGLKPPEIKMVLGGNVFKPWKLVTRPFQPEYPGDRQWNRKAPQLRFLPNTSDDLRYPSWLKILNHVGQGLTVALENNPWAKGNCITTGADYLKCWIASMIQNPCEPLPYLFIYSDAQNTGKSIFHEALSLLFYPGYQRADHALTNANFNAELEGAVLCVVEETDLNRNLTAYNRIKDWVTSRLLPIHRKMFTPYHIENTTHWVQCANTRIACPIFSGDTRITMLHVPNPPRDQIPKRKLLAMLEKEAPDFLGAIIRLEIPESNDRLNVPVIETDDKIAASEANRNALEVFIAERCYYSPGSAISLTEFYKTFIDWLDPTERFNWASKQKVSSKMPDKFPKGRLTSNSTWHWGNISFIPPTEEILNHPRYIARDGKLLETSE